MIAAAGIGIMIRPRPGQMPVSATGTVPIQKKKYPIMQLHIDPHFIKKSQGVQHQVVAHFSRRIRKKTQKIHKPLKNTKLITPVFISTNPLGCIPSLPLGCAKLIAAFVVAKANRPVAASPCRIMNFLAVLAGQININPSTS